MQSDRREQRAGRFLSCSGERCERFCAKLTVIGQESYDRCEQTATILYRFLPLNPCEDLNKYGRERELVSPIQPTFVSAYHAVHTMCDSRTN